MMPGQLTPFSSDPFSRFFFFHAFFFHIAVLGMQTLGLALSNREYTFLSLSISVLHASSRFLSASNSRSSFAEMTLVFFLRPCPACERVGMEGRRDGFLLVSSVVACSLEKERVSFLLSFAEEIGVWRCG